MASRKPSASAAHKLPGLRACGVPCSRHCATPAKHTAKQMGAAIITCQKRGPSGGFRSRFKALALAAPPAAITRSGVSPRVLARVAWLAKVRGWRLALLLFTQDAQTKMA